MPRPSRMTEEQKEWITLNCKDFTIQEMGKELKLKNKDISMFCYNNDLDFKHYRKSVRTPKEKVVSEFFDVNERDWAI